MALVLLRTFSLLLRILCKRPSFVAYASRIAKDSYTQQTKFINRCLSASNVALPVCALDLLGAMAAVDSSCAEFLFETIDFTMKSFLGFPTNRRKVTVDQATRVESDQRTAFINFYSALLSSGKYEVKQSCLKMNQFISPIVSGLFSDSPDGVLSFLSVIDSTILENEQHSKSMIVSFFTQGNINNLMKLLEYENPIIQARLLEILNKLVSPNSAANIIFKVERLADDAASCLRNKVLQNILAHLKVFDSMDQLQLAFSIIEACPDIANPFLRSAKYSFEAEISIKWLTLFSFMTKISGFRPAPEVEIEKVPSLEYLFASYCPPRACLNRALLNDSALVKMYSLQLLVALLRRVFWCIELIEKEYKYCAESSQEIAEMSKRMQKLQESRAATIAAAEKLFPDIQTLQSLLNLLLSEKEIQSSSTDLEVQLLPQDWRNQLVALCLDAFQFYIRVFISQEDSLGQAQFEDPVKFLAPLFSGKSVVVPSVLEMPVLSFAASFPKIICSSEATWANFFKFIGSVMVLHRSDLENLKGILAIRIFGSILYSTGLFINCPNEIRTISSALSDSTCFSRILADLSEIVSSSNNLIYEREFVSDGSVEVSPLLAKWLNLEISDEMYDFGHRILDELTAPTESSGDDEFKDGESSSLVNELKEDQEFFNAKRTKLSNESESESDSSDSDSSSDEDDAIRSWDKSKVSASKTRVAFDLPDPESTDPSIMFSLLLNQVDREQMHDFILNFPVERRLVPPAQRRRVNDNMLKDLLFGSEDFLLFCNWLGVLAHFVQVIPRQSFDAYTLVKCNLLGGIVMGLSSEDASMRRVCGHLLASIHDLIRPLASVSSVSYDRGISSYDNYNSENDNQTSVSSSDRCKQVYSLLSQLRRSIEYDDTVPGVSSTSLGFFKLSSLVALYYAEGLSVMIRPDHHMFNPIGQTVHSGAFQSLRGVPLFEELIRRNGDEEEAFLNRSVFIKQLLWMLRIIQFGCKSLSDFEKNGPMARSRVLETLLTLLTIFSRSIGKHPDSERSVLVILRTLKHLKTSVSGAGDLLSGEFGHAQWLEMLSDSILKVKTPLNKSRLANLEEGITQ